MMPSIRTFLLINLLLSVTLITSLAIIGNLYLSHKVVEQHLDTQLILEGLRIKVMLPKQLTKHTLAELQRKINSVPKRAMQIYRQQLNTSKPVRGEIQFQILNNDNKILLRSKDAPSIPLGNYRTVLKDRWVGDELWRVFTVTYPQAKLRIVVAERHDFREKLEARITKDSILIILITSPFLGLLIWIIIGRGLDPVKRVTEEVHHRAPSYLEPVDLEGVPPELKPLIDELNKLLGKVQAAFEREKRFAADAAHELRTPLAALKAQAQVALKETDEKIREQTLRKVIASVDRSTHVVQQLLTLSRITPQTQTYELVPLNLSKEAAEAIAELVPVAMKKNTDIELISTDPPPKILGNATAISIMVRNLVDNAIRYTPMNSLIKVIIQKERGHVLLKVIDNGPGIPEELRERVFERFYRILGSKASGSGLGLGIVLQIAELHNAKVTLDTPETGIGLEVTVKFTTF